MHTFALAVILSLGVLVAQPGRSFDVVSVKPHTPDGDAGVRVDTQPGGRLTIANASLRMLLTFAYRLQDDQVVGGAEWTTTDRFDIVAKVEREATTEELFVMLRPVLRDRFRLGLQNATRDLPVYALTARSDGKGRSTQALGRRLHWTAWKRRPRVRVQRPRWLDSRARDADATAGRRVIAVRRPDRRGSYGTRLTAGFRSDMVDVLVIERAEKPTAD